MSTAVRCPVCGAAPGMTCSVRPEDAGERVAFEGMHRGRELAFQERERTPERLQERQVLALERIAAALEKLVKDGRRALVDKLFGP